MASCEIRLLSVCLPLMTSVQTGVRVRVCVRARTCLRTQCRLMEVKWPDAPCTRWPCLRVPALQCPPCEHQQMVSPLSLSVAGSQVGTGYSKTRIIHQMPGLVPGLCQALKKLYLSFWVVILFCVQLFLLFYYKGPGSQLIFLSLRGKNCSLISLHFRGPKVKFVSLQAAVRQLSG